MLIGSLENGNMVLDFAKYSKTVTAQQWKEMFVGNSLVKTSVLTEDEYLELHLNIEAKRTGKGLGLINQEILEAAQC